MADGAPKDYSTMYCEDNSINIKPPPIPSSRNKFLKAPLDGCLVPMKHREQAVDLRQVVAKLEKFSHENNCAYAMDTLTKHYSAVFTDRKRNPSTVYKAYIQYFNGKDTYVVRVDKNTLGAVKSKLPIRGNYRYFFKRSENTSEEVDDDESTVPLFEKDGHKQIYCQVFPIL